MTALPNEPADPTTDATDPVPTDSVSADPAPTDLTSPTSAPNPDPIKEPVAPRTPVPDVLVGTWDGGTQGATAGRSYKFGPQGDVLARRGNAELAGTVVVASGTLTLYFAGLAPQQYRWSTDSYSLEGYDFTNLYLDGYTYVRQD